MYKKELDELQNNIQELKKLKNYSDTVAVNSTIQTALLFTIAKILDETHPK